MDQESRWYSLFKRLDQNKNHPTVSPVSVSEVHDQLQPGTGGLQGGQAPFGFWAPANLEDSKLLRPQSYHIYLLNIPT